MKIWRVFAIATLVLAACGSEPPPEASNDLLYLQTEAGLAIAAAGSDSAEFQASDSLPSADWSTVVRAGRHPAGTRVSGSDPHSGEKVWSKILDGPLGLKIVSGDGTMAALGPTREPYYSQGRRSTELVVVGASRDEQTYSLDGNYEPEAFSTDGGNLFVIEYLPAARPTHYRVRNLDLTTGVVGGVYTVDAELQETMRGTARVQTMDLEGTRLYTLYTLKQHGERHTFVHVLSLDEEWAHCVDLPDGFQYSTGTATSMSVTPDGDRLLIANSESGALAEVDTEALAVTRTGQVSFGLGKPTHMAIGDERLFLSSGRMMTVVSLKTLEEMRSLFMAQPITGLQAAADGFRLYIGQKNRIGVVDVTTGERLESFDPPGVDRVQRIGRATQQPPQPRSDDIIKCAC